MKRRIFLSLGAALTGIAGLGWWQRNTIAGGLIRSRNNQGIELTAAGDGCATTPSQIDGPYFFSAPVRSDIREDREGLPLELAIQIVQGVECRPVTDIGIEIWHCDSAGRYSGYDESITRSPFDTLRYVAGSEDGRVTPENNKTYLRGAQVADAAGKVKFQTIFPGWYDPRVPHIHVKVLRGNENLLTTQLYFPDELTHQIYGENEHYKPHGELPYHLGNDVVLGEHPDSNGLLLEPVETSAGLKVSCRLAIV